MKFDIKLMLLFAAILMICCLIIILGNNRFDNEVIAQIKQGDKIIKTVNLSEVKEPYEFQVKTNDGEYNNIRVEHGRIAVIDSDCPDKICVHQGYIHNGSLPIVCLPHRLSVTIVNEPDIDAVVGDN